MIRGAIGRRLLGPQAIGAVVAGAIVFLVVPVMVIVMYSVNPTAYFAFPPAGITGKWFANFFGSDNFRKAIRVSFLLALTVTPIATAIGIMAALALVRHRFPGRQLLSGLFMSPLIIPGVVTGMALLSLFSAAGMRHSFLNLVIGLTLFTLPFSIRAVVANLHGLSPTIEEAAVNLGAKPLQTFLHVTLPQLRPGIVAGGIFVFVEVLDNFSIAIFLTDTTTTTLPIEAFAYVRDIDDPTVAAMATFLVALTVGLVFLIERLVGLDRFMSLD